MASKAKKRAVLCAGGNNVAAPLVALGIMLAMMLLAPQAAFAQASDPLQPMELPAGIARSGEFANGNCWWAFLDEAASVGGDVYAAGTLLVGAGPGADKEVSEYAWLGPNGAWNGNGLPWIRAGVRMQDITAVVGFGGIRPVNLAGMTANEDYSLSWFGGGSNGCHSSLSSFDGRGIDVSGCTSLAGLLWKAGTSGSLSVNVSGWDTSGVSSFAYAFYGCSSLSALDIGGWNMTKSATAASRRGMLAGCASLRTLTLGSGNVLTGAGLEAGSAAGRTWVASAGGSGGSNGSSASSGGLTGSQLMARYSAGGNGGGAVTWTSVEPVAVDDRVETDAGRDAGAVQPGAQDVVNRVSEEPVADPPMQWEPVVNPVEPAPPAADSATPTPAAPATPSRTATAESKALAVTPVTSTPIETAYSFLAGDSSGGYWDSSSEAPDLAEAFANMTSSEKAQVVGNVASTLAAVSLLASLLGVGVSVGATLTAGVVGVAGTAGATGAADLAAELMASNAANGEGFGKRRKRQGDDGGDDDGDDDDGDGA